MRILIYKRVYKFTFLWDQGNTVGPDRKQMSERQIQIRSIEKHIFQRETKSLIHVVTKKIIPKRRVKIPPPTICKVLFEWGEKCVADNPFYLIQYCR